MKKAIIFLVLSLLFVSQRAFPQSNEDMEKLYQDIMEGNADSSKIEEFNNKLYEIQKS
jgi:hypothetical protein